MYVGSSVTWDDKDEVRSSSKEVVDEFAKAVLSRGLMRKHLVAIMPSICCTENANLLLIRRSLF